MVVNTTFFFFFEVRRGRRSGNSTFIRNVDQESSINFRHEEYTFSGKYSPEDELSFKERMSVELSSYVRRSPSISSCMFICPEISNRKYYLEKKVYCKKLTERHAEIIINAIVGMARRRFLNPNIFKL